MFKVVVLDHTFGNVDIARKILQPIGAEVFEYQCMDPEEALPLVEDADAVMVTNGKTMTRDTISKLRKCRVIAKHGIGPDIIDVEAATEHGIMVTNVPDYCLNEVSHHALALVFACARKLALCDDQVRNRLVHDPPALRPIKPLHRSVFGIVGLGRIGRITAGTLATISGSVVFFDPFFDGDYEVNGVVVRNAGFEELIEQSDFIIIHAPATKDNYHMFNAKAFAKMKKHPFIINVGRGELVDNAALLEALDSGCISGAGLDVVEGMPPMRKDDPLLTYPNVIFTPHSAWYSEGSFEDLQEKAAMEVRRVLTGEQPVAWYNRREMSGSADDSPTSTGS